MQIILDKKEISALDMDDVHSRAHALDKRNILKPPGKSHYRLLAYLSFQFNGIEIADVGTRRGASAYSLAQNPNNTVYTFDIDVVHDLTGRPQTPPNVFFSAHNCVEDATPLLNKELIFIDVRPHDGKKERAIFKQLRESKWKGILLLDDILHYKAMRQFWRSIKREKYNITEYGHGTGTGLVIFGDYSLVRK